MPVVSLKPSIREFEDFTVDVGYGMWERTGCPCADREIAEVIKTADAILFGAITTPPMKDYQSVVLRIRKALDLYANLRPVKGDGFDIMIVRENTEGLYSGIEEIGRPGRRPSAWSPGPGASGLPGPADTARAGATRPPDHRA